MNDRLRRVFGWSPPLAAATLLLPLPALAQLEEVVVSAQKRLQSMQDVGISVTALSAEQLEDLRAPPGNRLEALKGGRAGQHSIRINEQWRLCFRWRNGQAHEVEIVDYH